MGTFGVGSFANDEALNWIDSFLWKRSFASLSKEVQKFLKKQAHPAKVQAVLEVVAGLHGHPVEDFPAELLPWTAKNAKKLESELIESSLKAVTVLRHSSLADLWPDEESKSEWLLGIDDLERRLSSEKKELQKFPRLKRPGGFAPILISKGGGAQIGVYPEETLPDLSRLPNELGTWIRFRLDFLLGDEERSLIGSWLGTYPDLPLVKIQTREEDKGEVPPDALRHFKDLRRLDLDIESSIDFGRLQEFSKLLELSISEVSDPDILTFCRSLNLENLRINAKNLNLQPLLEMSQLRTLKFVDPFEASGGIQLNGTEEIQSHVRTLIQKE